MVHYIRRLWDTHSVTIRLYLFTPEYLWIISWMVHYIKRLWDICSVTMRPFLFTPGCRRIISWMVHYTEKQWNEYSNRTSFYIFISRYCWDTTSRELHRIAEPWEKFLIIIRFCLLMPMGSSVKIGMGLCVEMFFLYYEYYECYGPALIIGYILSITLLILLAYYPAVISYGLKLSRLRNLIIQKYRPNGRFTNKRAKREC